MALNLEPVYKEIFNKFKTRKKFSIRSVEKNVLILEQDEEICGQKEPRSLNLRVQENLRNSLDWKTSLKQIL